MTDRIRTVLAALLLGVGLLWLLGAVGLAEGRVLTALAAYWPLLVIGLGLDLLLRPRRAAGMPFSLLALGAVVVLALTPGLPGLTGSVWTGSVWTTEQRFSEPVGVAHAAEIRLEPEGAELRLGANGSTDTLIEAVLEDPREVRFEVAGGERKRVVLARRGGVGLPSAATARWQIGLSPVVPLDLIIDAGSGPAELDLSGLELATLTLAGGSGVTDLTLSAHAARSEARLELGSGSTTVRAPAGANLALRAETGSGATSFRFAEASYVTLELASGSGPVDIDLPDGANVKLEVLDDGSGPLRLPGTLARRSGRGAQGSWQTEGFTPGAGQFIITVREVGSGPITLR